MQKTWHLVKKFGVWKNRQTATQTKCGTFLTVVTYFKQIVNNEVL